MFQFITATIYNCYYSKMIKKIEAIEELKYNSVDLSIICKYIFSNYKFLRN